MKSLFFAILFLTSTAFAQLPANPDEAKTWLIEHFGIPPEAKITYFFSTGHPVEIAAINWELTVNGWREGHSRSYDFKAQTVTNQIDD